MKDRPRRVREAVPPQLAGERLDRVLAALVPGLSRRRARVLLDIGGVWVGGARVRIAGRRMRAGEELEVHIGRALAEASRPEEPLPEAAVVFEDDDLIVVDKPFGLFTAPTRESDRHSLVRLLAKRGRQPWVVHRIDGEASGLVVLARTRAAAANLSEALRDHRIDRRYLAVVGGRTASGERVVDLPLDGRPARTHVVPLEVLGERATVIGCRLETGRTHQIRRHLAMSGHPVLGDRRYGDRSDIDPPRLALHACRLGFRHPRGGQELVFERRWPAEIDRWLEALRHG